MVVERVPPNNLDAEKSLLCSLLIDKDAIVKVAHLLKPEHFYERRNGEIYKAVIDLFLGGVAVDSVTVLDYLKKKKKLRGIGGRAYITSLLNAAPTSAHVIEYSKIVRENAIRRGLISAAATITDLAFDSDKESVEVLSRAQQEIFGVSAEGVDRGFVHIKDVLEETYEEAANLNDGTDKKVVKTGFVDLDGLIGGFQKSDLIILAARPSMGKTSLALDFVRNAAIDQKKKVAFFSLEMSRQQLNYRLLAMVSGVGIWDLRTGRLKDEDSVKLADGLGILSESDIWMDDTAGQNILEIRTKARRLFLEHGIDMILVDYLQLIQGNSKEGRVQEISQVSMELKNMARELNVPVIALSQLSRKVESRDDKIPQLSDLRDSGSIEQDADIVMFIHRDDYYNPDSEKQGIAEIKIAKHRNGPTGSVELVFLKELASFRNKLKE